MKQPLVLYVEDDETLGFITTENLERAGFRVVMATDGIKGWDEFVSAGPDVCVLDVNLPKMDGFTLARKIRERNQQVPILFVTAKSLKEDRLEGLLLGGDDYLVKPFSIEELILKIRIFLRRSGFSADTAPKEMLALGTLRLDKSNLMIIDGEEEITLTYREAELLEYFIKNAGVLLPREQILETLWGGNDYFAGRSLDVYISRLRKYLSRDARIRIENRHGIGFIFRIDSI